MTTHPGYTEDRQSNFTDWVDESDRILIQKEDDKNLFTFSVTVSNGHRDPSSGLYDEIMLAQGETLTFEMADAAARAVLAEAERAEEAAYDAQADAL